MQVTLTPELERMVSEKVAAGRYQSVSQVLEEAVHLFDERDSEIQRLRAEIQIGLDSD